MEYKVKFKHSCETGYTGTVEADSLEEAYDKAVGGPFDIKNLESGREQEIDIFDIEVEEIEEDKI